MAKRDMRFLDMHRHLAWNGEKHIGTFRQLAAAIARHGTDPDAVLARRLAGRHHISGIAACRNRDQHVTGPAQCFHLPCKDTFKAKIICIGCQERGVRGQRQRSQPVTGTPVIERGDKFGSKMLRVASRATISAEHELATAIKACSDHFSCLHHRFATVRSSLQFHLGRGCEEGVNIGGAEA